MVFRIEQQLWLDFICQYPAAAQKYKTTMAACLDWLAVTP